MFTATQMDYLREVLGVSVVARPQPRKRPEQPEILILTNVLNGEERRLLTKILDSVKLEGHRHIEVREQRPPAGLGALHILSFLGEPGAERVEKGSSVWWNFPLLHEMTLTGPEVVAKKRQAWALLQRFAKEFSA
jgi:hypothetical protein